MKLSLWIAFLFAMPNAYAFDEQDLRSPVSPPAVQVDEPAEVKDPVEQPPELEQPNSDPYVYGDYSMSAPGSSFGTPQLHGFRLGLVLNQNGLGINSGVDFALNDYVSVVPKLFYKGRYLVDDSFLRQLGPQAELRLHGSPVRTIEFFAASSVGYNFWRVDEKTEDGGTASVRGQSTMLQGIVGVASLFTPRFRFVFQRVWMSFIHSTTDPVRISEFRKPEFEAAFEYVI